MKRSLFGAAFVLHRAINSTGTLLLFPKHLHEKNDFLINSAGILRPTQQPRGVSLLLSHWYICAGETFSLLHCHSGSVGRKRKSGELTKQRKVTPEGERAHSLEPQLAKVEPSTRSTAGRDRFAGQRALSLSAELIMACTTFIKDTAGWRGTLSLLLLGLLLHSVIVSGQNNMTSTTMMPTTTATQSTEPSTATTTSTASAPTSTSTTIPTTSASTAAPATQSAASTASGATTYTGTTQSLTTTATSGGSASATTAATSTGSTMTTSGGQATATSVTTQPPTATATSGGIASTTTNQSLTIMTTSGGTATSTPTQSPTATSGGIASTTTNQSLTIMTTSGGAATSTPTQSPTATSGAMTQYTSAMPTNCSVVTMMSNSSSSNYTDKPVMNGTMMISCPAFTCNHSTCYTMYTSQNATPCGAGVCFCQLTRQMDMWYTANCTTSCAAPCANTSDTNCSVVCCYSPDCLNRSFTSMMMTTTVAPTTTTTATTTTTPQTTNNANQCHTGTCIGITCYTEFADAEKCSSSQPHCQLKQETVAGGLQWTAGCSTNCSTQTPCKTSTQPPCHLECCNATKTSCLWRNGTLHVPNFAPGGPRHHTELIAILLCLLAIAWVNE